MVDAIVLSDLHLGSSACRIDKLLDFLSSDHQARRIILNGDVLDYSYYYYLPVSAVRAFHLLTQVAHQKKAQIIWVAGNHDRGAIEWALRFGLVFLEQYTFRSGDKTIICEHGDRFDEFLSSHPLLGKIAVRAHRWLDAFCPSLAHVVKRRSKSWVQCCANVWARAVQSKSPDDIILCGHTHMAMASPETGYYNSGSWTEDDCHYLVVQDGQVSVHRWNG